MIPIYCPADIGPHLDIAAMVPSAKQAFRAISDRTAQSPVLVLHPNDMADIHVKSAALPDCPIFTVKMAGWSQILADQGEPPSSGMIAVFDSATCKPLAILQDGHLISDYRTAAAGALAAQVLAPRNARKALIAGTGIQARLQAEALLITLALEKVTVWGRNTSRANRLAAELSHAFPKCRFDLTESLEKAANDADVIVTATGAKEPIIEADWLRPGQHLTSVGSDDSTKCEIAPGALASARLYVDSVESAERYGNTHRALTTGLVDKRHFTELGSVIDSRFIRHPSDITIVSLSGLGIQDLTAVNQILAALRCRDGSGNARQRVET